MSSGFDKALCAGATPADEDEAVFQQWRELGHLFPLVSSIDAKLS